MAEDIKQFSASEPALGYLYQIRISLLWSLERLTKGESFEVSLETLDDVAFESNGEARELLQTKLHKNKEANLNDASPDLWKTIRIWIASIDSGVITSDTSLHLVTTEQAAKGSIAYKLKKESKDVNSAVQALTKVAEDSSNKINGTAYECFLDKTPAERESLVKMITVIDAALDISEVHRNLVKEIYHAAPKYKKETFLDYLEGWWFNRCILQLQDREARILSEEIEEQMSDLRNQFRADNLPIADDLLQFSLDDETSENHKNFNFVKQVQLATSNRLRISSAIQDYYRAFEQRSRWQRQDLLYVGDLRRYEKGLFEEWSLQFASCEDELGDEATDVDKKKVARDVLKWAEQGSIKSRIKPDVTEPFIARGSLHMLADELKIGWHPEFKTLIEKTVISEL